MKYAYKTLFILINISFAFWADITPSYAFQDSTISQSIRNSAIEENNNADSTVINLLKAIDFEVLIKLRDGNRYRDKVQVMDKGLLIERVTFGTTKKREEIHISWGEIEQVKIIYPHSSKIIMVVGCVSAFILGAAIGY